MSRLAKKHEADWTQLWNRSSISLPDARVEKLYYVELYKHWCSSRPGKRAVTLQGLWTTDGAAAPWRGSYTTDMNVEECHWPIYTSNHLDSGEPLYAMYWRRPEVHRSRQRPVRRRSRQSQSPRRQGWLDDWRDG